MAAVIRLPIAEYVQFISEFIDKMDPATRTHLAVAYQNLIPLVSAMYQFNRERGQTFEIEGFLEEVCEKLEEPLDEISNRRYSWLLFAGLVARLEKLARIDDRVVPVAATIWTIIVTEYPRLKVLLPDNIVWNDDEKLWFELDQTDDRLIELGVNHHIPLKFAKHEIVKRFAKDMGAFYMPSGTRIGYVP